MKKEKKMGWAAAVCLLLLLFGVTVYMLRAFQRMTVTGALRRKKHAGGSIMALITR